MTRRERFALWRCRVMDWHPWRCVEPESFDGASYGGTCTRCGAHVLLDSQGGWFATGGSR